MSNHHEFVENFQGGKILLVKTGTLRRFYLWESNKQNTKSFGADNLDELKKLVDAEIN